jgi:8-oxo-dGDP phosphatase
MKWDVLGERIIHDSPWMRVVQAQVSLPSGKYIDDYHLIRSTGDAAGLVVTDPQHGVLLLWRHRFPTDTWGWEVPAGRVDPDETNAEAAARECLEETGWRPGPLAPIGSYFPNNGQSDIAFHLFRAEGATYVGEPTDPDEAERVAWVSWDDIRAAILHGHIQDGLSLTALLWCLAEPKATDT